jgi:hypothetical protein
MYAVIRNSEDGIFVDLLSKEDLKKRLEVEDGTNYYGRTKFSSPDSNLPLSFNTENFKEDELLILKCEIVVPREKKVTTVLEID